MKYIISFNNGHKMKIAVEDGPKFLEHLCRGSFEKPGAEKQFYCDGIILVSINEITAVHPEYLSG